MVIKLKVKYLRLDKDKRKEVKQKYYETSLGKYVKKKLISSFICGVLCIGIGIYLLISTKDPKFIDYFYNISILLIGFGFIFAIKKIEVKKINEYVIKNKI